MATFYLVLSWLFLARRFIILLLLSDDPMCSNQFLADLHDNYEAITKHGIYAKPPTGTILPHSPGRTYVNYKLQLSWSYAQILWLSAANASGNSDNLFVGDIVKLRCKKSLRPTKLPMVDDQDDDPTDGTLTTYCMPPINMGEFGEWELTPTFQSVYNNVKIPALSLLWLVWFFNTSGHKDLST